MEGFNKILKTLAWCLVLQATTFSLTVLSQQQQQQNATVKIMVQNELKDPTPYRILYRCWSRNRDFGWRRSVITGSRYSFEVSVVDAAGEDERVNHVCHFRSELGFVNILISQANARKCRKAVCVHVVTTNGVEFRGIGYGKGKSTTRPRVASYRQLPWTPFRGLVPQIPVVGSLVGSKAQFDD